jgi:hypothetical protein
VDCVGLGTTPCSHRLSPLPPHPVPHFPRTLPLLDHPPGTLAGVLKTEVAHTHTLARMCVSCVCERWRGIAEVWSGHAKHWPT